MQVAHRDDYDTHAVIGGKGVQEFGIAQTAEFFTVLSNTLYSNKPLAVIREVLCNAWDAHIVSGRTDLPVIVTIDEDKLSIKDSGHGIPHDLIHSIYCVYGNSTKENDGNQTGGFGLGSKSPFAYSDHFTVVNQHALKKTVHAISRGSALTQSKPDRRVMVEVPTTETGVEVIIPVKNRIDMQQFIDIAKDVAAFGEMNVLINGTQVEIVPISTGENNMFLTTRAPQGVHNKICLRYGNVVYPVQPDAEYIGLYKKLMDILKDIPNSNHYYRNDENDFKLILQAPANSISVTPSRESLSNTETTIRTIKKLFTEIIDYMQLGSAMFEQRLLEEQAKAAEYMIQNGVGERIYFSDNLLTDHHGPKTVATIERFHQITNMIGLANYYLRYKKDISDKIQRKLDKQRLEILIRANIRHGYKLKELSKFFHMPYGGLTFKKTLMRSLLKRITKHELLSHKCMHIVRWAGNGRYSWADYHRYIPDNKQFLPLLQGVVVVTHNKMAYEQEWHLMDIDALYPNEQPRIVYLAPRTKGHKEAAIEFFTKHGYHVIDFATVLDEHRAAKRVEKPKLVSAPAPVRERKQGLVLLSQSVSPGGRFNINRHLDVDINRSTEFDYVFKPHNLSGKRTGNKVFFPWGNNHAADIISLFGSNIGICVNEPQYESQIKKGKKDGLLHIVEQVTNKVLTSPNIKFHVENQRGLKRSHHLFDNLLEMAKLSSVLHKALKIPNINADNTDLIYFEIYEIMVSYVHYNQTRPENGSWKQPVWDAMQVVKTWEALPTYAELNKRIEKSEGIKYLKIYDMLSALRNMSKSNPDYQKRIFIETSVINALSF